MSNKRKTPVFQRIVDEFQKIGDTRDKKVFVKLDSANKVNLYGFSRDRLHVVQVKLLYVSMRVFAECLDDIEKRLDDIERERREH